MNTVDRIANTLTDAQRHVVMRCSEAVDWSTGREVGCARSWIDLVHGRRHVSMTSLRALERRGIIEICAAGVRLSVLGLGVWASLRCRGAA